MLTDANQQAHPLTEMQDKQPMSRRALIIGGAAAASAALFALAHRPLAIARAATQRGAGLPATVRIVNFDAAGRSLGVAEVPTVSKDDSAWRAQLSSRSYEITRHSDTEMAFTGPLTEEHRAGLFRCICCDTPLFSSAAKFDSGTGWPSFFQPVAKQNVREDRDSTLGMLRVAVSCPRCDAHLGHVFDDGPQPTGLRYCMNSAAMRFVAFS